MQTSSSWIKRLKKGFLFAFVLFVVMFAGRFGAGYLHTEQDDATNEYLQDFFGSVTNLRKNYASEKFEYEGESPKQQAPADGGPAHSQKFEKTASLKAKSADFEADEKRIRLKVKEFGAVIQYEQNTGNRGSRELHLMIGVIPDRFDSFYVHVQRIGRIRAREVTKVDKTNEYRQLNARKASLEKTLQSISELKNRGGNIQDYIVLHDKILDIEQQLQSLGVELGNFDSENEFCTVRFSLYEGFSLRKSTLTSRLGEALEWTIQYYALLVISIAFVAVGLFVLLIVMDKMRQWLQYISRD